MMAQPFSSRIVKTEECNEIGQIGSEFPPAIVMNEVQLILAQKRTSLASLRTGIAVAAIPMSIMGFLVATSRFYAIREVLPLFLSIMTFNASMLLLGTCLIFRAVRKLLQEDKLVCNIKSKHSSIAELIV